MNNQLLRVYILPVSSHIQPDDGCIASRNVQHAAELRAQPFMLYTQLRLTDRRWL
jgi:hypothetical protein